MTRAPYITINTRSRRRHHLRTNHHTMIKLSMWKKLMPSRKYRAARPHVGKADPALSLTGHVQRVCQIISKANPPLKSP
jgi:hypothetical protein